MVENFFSWEPNLDRLDRQDAVPNGLDAHDVIEPGVRNLRNICICAICRVVRMAKKESQNPRGRVAHD